MACLQVFSLRSLRLCGYKTNRKGARIAKKIEGIIIPQQVRHYTVFHSGFCSTEYRLNIEQTTAGMERSEMTEDYYVAIRLAKICTPMGRIGQDDRTEFTLLDDVCGV